MTFPRDIETQLLRLSPAKPASELRQKLLAQIDSATPARIHFLDRAWFSRPLRLAAVLMMVVATAVSISESRRLELQMVSIEGPAAEESSRSEPALTLERELGFADYDLVPWRLASRRSSLRSRTRQEQLATLMEL
jgi:hypothetical protein